MIQEGRKERKTSQKCIWITVAVSLLLIGVAVALILIFTLRGDSKSNSSSALRGDGDSKPNSSGGGSQPTTMPGGGGGGSNPNSSGGGSDPQYGPILKAEPAKHYSFFAAGRGFPADIGGIDWKLKSRNAPKHVTANAKSVVVAIEPKGTTNYLLKNKDDPRYSAWLQKNADGNEKKVGVMICGNSGAPGGNVGRGGAKGDELQLSQIKPDHRTQEEDIISNWLTTHATLKQSSTPKTKTTALETIQTALFNKTIKGKWGMKHMDKTDTQTIQGTDYTLTSLTPKRYEDAWVVKNTYLGEKQDTKFDAHHHFLADLIFVAGPNADTRSLGRRPESTMRRTFCKNCVPNHNYPFFRESVKATLRAGMDAAILNKNEILAVGQVSAGLYAGPHKAKINRDFVQIINELLNEPGRFGAAHRSDHFHEVLLVKLS